MTEWQEGKSREIERKRPLERWNKGEADGWKWRSNWIGRFVKMWWHKQSVHCYCTLLEVEGNILKLQEKKKRKKRERKHRSCQLSARNDRLKCFLFVPSPIHFSPSLARLYLLSSYYKNKKNKNHSWDLFNISIISLTRGSQVFWGLRTAALNAETKRTLNAN